MCLSFSFQGRAKVSLKNNCAGEKYRFSENVGIFNLGIFRDFWGYLEILEDRFLEHFRDICV